MSVKELIILNVMCTSPHAFKQLIYYCSFIEQLASFGTYKLCFAVKENLGHIFSHVKVTVYQPDTPCYSCPINAKQRK